MIAPVASELAHQVDRAVERERTRANNGRPIPRELRHQVFEKFVRGDWVGERRPGWGLGLFFCRLAVDAHGGSIAVEDVPGWSTSLVIRLPHTPRAERPVDESRADHAQVPAA